MSQNPPKIGTDFQGAINCPVEVQLTSILCVDAVRRLAISFRIEPLKQIPVDMAQT